jgi:hypothetical protein
MWTYLTNQNWDDFDQELFKGVRLPNQVNGHEQSRQGQRTSLGVSSAAGTENNSGPARIGGTPTILHNSTKPISPSNPPTIDPRLLRLRHAPSHVEAVAREPIGTGVSLAEHTNPAAGQPHPNSNAEQSSMLGQLLGLVPQPGLHQLLTKVHPLTPASDQSQWYQEAFKTLLASLLTELKGIFPQNQEVFYEPDGNCSQSTISNNDRRESSIFDNDGNYEGGDENYSDFDSSDDDCVFEDSESDDEVEKRIHYTEDDFVDFDASADETAVEVSSPADKTEKRIFYTEDDIVDFDALADEFAFANLPSTPASKTDKRIFYTEDDVVDFNASADEFADTLSGSANQNERTTSDNDDDESATESDGSAYDYIKRLAPTNNKMQQVPKNVKDKDRDSANRAVSSGVKQANTDTKQKKCATANDLSQINKASGDSAHSSINQLNPVLQNQQRISANTNINVNQARSNPDTSAPTRPNLGGKSIQMDDKTLEANQKARHDLEKKKMYRKKHRKSIPDDSDLDDEWHGSAAEDSETPLINLDRKKTASKRLHQSVEQDSETHGTGNDSAKQASIVAEMEKVSGKGRPVWIPAGIGAKGEQFEGDWYDIPKDYELSTSEKQVPNKTQPRSEWNEEEYLVAMYIMLQVFKKDKIHGESRFREGSRIMIALGFPRQWLAIKNRWCRGLRLRSGFDERKNKKAPLTTSKQDAATKRKNRALKEKTKSQAPSSSIVPSSAPKGSLKRDYEADSESDEVIPAKRQRGSPYEIDNFGALE